MATFTKILVPFDDDMRSIRALEYAAMFASGIGATITALHIADPNNYHTKEEFDKDLSAMVENELRPKLVQIQRRYPDIRQIDLQIRGMEHPIHQHIINFSLEKQIDFIVMRSHGLTEADDWELHFKSTNAYKVLLDAPCPVFTFTQIPDVPMMKEIVVPLDLNEGSLYKIPFAIIMAEQFKAKVHLVTSSEHKENHFELNRQMDEIYNQLTAKGIKTIKNDVYTSTLPEAIFSYCDQNEIDLVIITNRPGFRWSELLVSPIAKRIVSRSKVPVVSLRIDKSYDVGI